MENQETLIQEEIHFTNSNEIKEYLLQASKWGKFLGILGFIACGILVIVAITAMVGLSQIGTSQFDRISSTGFPALMIGIIYFVIAVITYFPAKFIYQFSVQIRRGINSSDIQAVSSGFRNLKSLFQFHGILAIIGISFYIIAILLLVMGAWFQYSR